MVAAPLHVGLAPALASHAGTRVRMLSRSRSEVLLQSSSSMCSSGCAVAIELRMSRSWSRNTTDVAIAKASLHSGPLLCVHQTVNVVIDQRKQDYGICHFHTSQ